MKYPLTHQPYRSRELDTDDVGLLKQFTDAATTATLSDYDYFVKQCCGEASQDLKHKWKLVKQRDNLCVYQDCAADFGCNAAVGMSSSTSLLCVGTIAGSLDDIMYGVVSHSAEDTLLKSSCIGSNVTDCCVLASIISPTTQDPWSSMALKWTVNSNPLLTRPFVQDRDFTYVESTGITTNLGGERVGYHIIHSVAVPDVGQLENRTVVRGNLSLYQLYRQKTPGTVEVFLRAFWELNGRMHPTIQRYSCVQATISIFQIQRWSRMKKLKWMQQKNCHETKRSDSKCCSLCKRWIGGWFASAHCCSVCRAAVCQRCTISKQLSFFSPATRKVEKKRRSICRRCIRESATTNNNQSPPPKLRRRRTTSALASRAQSMALTVSIDSQDSTKSANLHP